MMEYLAVATPRPELGNRAQARTLEIERCLKMNPEWILMLDLDQTLPIVLNANAIKDKDVVVIDAPNKGRSDSNVFYNPDRTLSHFTISCCFIRPHVFRSMEKPWFRTDLAYVIQQPRDGRIVFDIQQKAMDDNIGEDVYFSTKVLENGWKVYVIPDAKSKHFYLDAQAKSDI